MYTIAETHVSCLYFGMLVLYFPFAQNDVQSFFLKNFRINLFLLLFICHIYHKYELSCSFLKNYLNIFGECAYILNANESPDMVSVCYQE